MPVSPGDPSARVDDEEDRIAVGERGLGLRPHAPGKRLGIAFLEPRRVDHREGEIQQPPFALAPVAGDARLIVDQREFCRPAG